MENLELGLAKRDWGVAKTTVKNADWMQQAIEVCRKDRRPGLVVDVSIIRMYVVEEAGHPSSPNAWGALFRHLQSKGMLEHTGVYVRSHRPEARGRQIPVWRWK